VPSWPAPFLALATFPPPPHSNHIASSRAVRSCFKHLVLRLKPAP
jgi:hypothetical protein